MRAVTCVATALILLTVIAGCGQKGALYRDHQDVPAAVTSVTPANAMTNSSETQRSKDADK